MTHPSDHTLQTLLRLNQLGAAAKRQIAAVLLSGGPPQEICDRILADDLFGATEKLNQILAVFDPCREIEQCFQQGIRLYSILDPDYPADLRRTAQPPLVIYVNGTLHVSDRAAVAVVGTRHPSFYGTTQARRFSRAFAEHGLTVVSGLARGIDQAAHAAALEVSHGRTLAVLGSGLDCIYPRENAALAEQIKTRGAVLSEYPLGTPPSAYHFPERNRIISGLSRAVVVMEAHYRSGALITAHEAAEEGKDVFAVPGPVDQVTSRGTHRLLKEGAFLAESPEDVMDMVLQGLSAAGDLPAFIFSNIPVPAQASPAPCEFVLENSEQRILDLLKAQALSREQLLELWQDGSVDVLPLLTRLEIRGKILKQMDGCFRIQE